MFLIESCFLVIWGPRRRSIDNFRMYVKELGREGGPDSNGSRCGAVAAVGPFAGFMCVESAHVLYTAYRYLCLLLVQ
jgi:hypothetical protein